jgi:hypothetical protein
MRTFWSLWVLLLDVLRLLVVFLLRPLPGDFQFQPSAYVPRAAQPLTDIARKWVFWGRLRGAFRCEKRSKKIFLR